MTSARRATLEASLLASALIVIGILHLIAPQPFDEIMPRVLPEATHRPLTYLSGLAEIACGVLLALPRTRWLGGRATQVLLLAVWPANIDVALRGDELAGSTAAAWLRVPLQIPLIMFAGHIAREALRFAPGSHRQIEEQQ